MNRGDKSAKLDDSQVLRYCRTLRWFFFFFHFSFSFFPWQLIRYSDRNVVTQHFSFLSLSGSLYIISFFFCFGGQSVCVCLTSQTMKTRLSTRANHTHIYTHLTKGRKSVQAAIWLNDGCERNDLARAATTLPHHTHTHIQTIQTKNLATHIPHLGFFHLDLFPHV